MNTGGGARKGITPSPIFDWGAKPDPGLDNLANLNLEDGRSVHEVEQAYGFTQWLCRVSVKLYMGVVQGGVSPDFLLSISVSLH